MTSRYRHRRTPLPATPFPSPVEPGEIVVNTAQRQIAVGDAAAGTLGQPKPLIGVRFFDPTAAYVLNDVVTQAGRIYKANGTIPPGAFNASNWTEIGAGGFASGVASDPVGNVAATNVQAAIAELDAEKVKKNGDVMTGHLTLPASPAADQAVRKDYVDAADAGLQADVNAKADTSYVDAQDAALQIYVDSKVVAPATVAPVMDGAATVGVTTKYAREDHVHPTDTSRAADAVVVKTSTQSLTAAQQIQARQNIYAAPFDALAYNGMQINGDFVVDQLNGGSSYAVVAGSSIPYLMDGWSIVKAGTNAFTVQQVASVFPGYTKELKLTVTTAQASIGSDYIILQHKIEGFRFAKAGWGTAAAQSVSVSFWIKSSVAGSFFIQISDNASGAVTATPSIATAGVAQFINVTFPAQTSWTGLNTNGIGCAVKIYLAAASMINIAATNGNTIEITGLVVLPGIETPTVAQSPNIMRPYGDELATCQRYWQKIVTGITSYYNVGTVPVGGYITYPCTMRAAPTVSPTFAYTNASGGAVDQITASSFRLQGLVTAAGTFDLVLISGICDARL